MTPLTDLPVELLSQIVWYLRDDHPSLIAVALTSHSLNELAQPALLHSLTFTLDDKMPSHILKQSPMNRLRARLASNHHLAQLVRSVDLTWHCYTSMFDSMPEEYVGDECGLIMIGRLLEVLPSLQCLKLTAPLFGQDYFKPTLFGNNNMDMLTTVGIHEVTTLPATIEALMCLKSIEKMMISRVTRTNPRHTPLHVGTSPLSTLILGSSINPEDLRSILLVPKDLKILSFAFRYLGEPWNWAMGTVLRPSSFVSTLSLTQHSLVGLEILSDEFRPLDVDKTRLDLSNFVCLKKVSIPSNFIFFTSGAHWSRDGLWKLLPPQIEILKISFVPRQKLIDRSDVLYGIVTEALNWLNELALRKKLLFPALSRIRLHENLPAFLKDESWVPKSTKEVYGENEIDLKFYELFDYNNRWS